eukprot:CAMPEP_0171056250 /NCGR_PEP_ID=MMETSP0766_2-20121228/698_1 /TAXON_ID=439317 /ORGANISM="Gambierdiscus australes, Strain CAWD 149" /LENGTH=34 /DNA_ID= /DNA_START= /DNA_END= /DNA_ORIENTATION=
MTLDGSAKRIGGAARLLECLLPPAQEEYPEELSP